MRGEAAEGVRGRFFLLRRVRRQRGGEGGELLRLLVALPGELLVLAGLLLELEVVGARCVGLARGEGSVGGLRFLRKDGCSINGCDSKASGVPGDSPGAS